MNLREFSILGSGSYIPKKRVPAADLDKKMGLPEGTTLKKSGVAWRHYADPQKESNSIMAAAAAKKALEQAQLKPEDLDAIICASGSVEQIIPSGGVLVQKELGLGLSGIPAFSIDSTCLSFLTALDTVSYMIQAGKYKNVLIVSSEIASVGLNWKQPESASLFGDGAAAFVLGQADGTKPSTKILASKMSTYSVSAHDCEIAGGGSRVNIRTEGVEGPDDPKYLFNMDGPSMFALTLEKAPLFITELIQEAGISLSDLAYVVPHQASLSAMNLMKRALKFSSDKWMTIIPDYGNMIAACIPFGFHLAREQEKIKKGDKVLLCGTSAGISFGGMVLEY